MPKPRAVLTPIEEAIISKGGEPGTGLSSVQPDPVPAKTRKPAKAAPPVEEDDDEDGGTPLYRHTMVRFKPKDFDAFKEAAKRQSEELSMKVSFNSWVISACREKLKRDSE